jgi:hypothetical protein
MCACGPAGTLRGWEEAKANADQSSGDPAYLRWINQLHQPSGLAAACAGAGRPGPYMAGKDLRPVVGPLRRLTDGTNNRDRTMNWLPVGVKATQGLTWLREMVSGQLPRPNQRSGGRMCICGPAGTLQGWRRLTSAWRPDKLTFQPSRTTQRSGGRMCICGSAGTLHGWRRHRPGGRVFSTGRKTSRNSIKRVAGCKSQGLKQDQ